MMKMLTMLRRDAGGATALEYGLILCLIVLALVSGLTALGSETNSQWTYVATQVSSAVAYATS